MIVLIGFIVGIALSLICFISTENLISTALIGFISILYFLIYVRKVIKGKDEKVTRFQDCYQFINNFLIALSIKGHVSGALASTLESQNEETIDLVKSIDSNDPMEKVIYLKDYFKFDIYSLFVDLISLYNDEGGDIIQMSRYLLNQIREEEEFIVNVERMSKKAIVEFTILWSFALSILAILKFSLDDFFKHIVANVFYQISVICILLFALFSVHLAVKKVIDVKLKGWN